MSCKTLLLFSKSTSLCSCIDLEWSPSLFYIFAALKLVEWTWNLQFEKLRPVCFCTWVELDVVSCCFLKSLPSIRLLGLTRFCFSTDKKVILTLCYKSNVVQKVQHRKHVWFCFNWPSHSNSRDYGYLSLILFASCFQLLSVCSLADNGCFV